MRRLLDHRKRGARSTSPRPRWPRAETAGPARRPAPACAARIVGSVAVAFEAASAATWLRNDTWTAGTDNPLPVSPAPPRRRVVEECRGDTPRTGSEPRGTVDRAEELAPRVEKLGCCVRCSPCCGSQYQVVDEVPGSAPRIHGDHAAHRFPTTSTRAMSRCRTTPSCRRHRAHSAAGLERRRAPQPRFSNTMTRASSRAVRIPGSRTRCRPQGGDEQQWLAACRAPRSTGPRRMRECAHPVFLRCVRSSALAIQQFRICAIRQNRARRWAPLSN